MNVRLPSGRARARIVVVAAAVAIGAVAGVAFVTKESITTRVVEVRAVGTEVTDSEWACRADAGSCTANKTIAGQVSPPTAFGMSKRDVRAELHLANDGRYSIQWACRSTADDPSDLKIINARTEYRIERTEKALWGGKKVRTSQKLNVLHPLRGICVPGEIL